MGPKRYFVSYYRRETKGLQKGFHVENGFVEGDPVMWVIRCRKNRPEEEITLIQWHAVTEEEYQAYMDEGRLAESPEPSGRDGEPMHFMVLYGIESGDEGEERIESHTVCVETDSDDMDALEESLQRKHASDGRVKILHSSRISPDNYRQWCDIQKDRKADPRRKLGRD